MRLRRHLYVGDASVLPQVRQLVIVDLDSLRALNTKQFATELITLYISE